MPITTSTELKKVLAQAGFEIYRTQPDQVVLAERVRDNLIMDSGVAARSGSAPAVRIVLRAQASDFPSDTPEALFARARALAERPISEGYSEIGATTVPVKDPGDDSRTLDVWHEITLDKQVRDEAELIEELKRALKFEKAAVADARR